MSKSQLLLADFFPYQLTNVSQRVSSQLAGTYEKRFGLTNPQWRVLACLGEKSRATSTMIAGENFMDKVKTSRAIKQLEKKGLVSRQPDANDSRFFWISLNPRGEKLYRDIVPYALQWEQTFLAVLTEKENKTLKKLVSKLKDHLDCIEKKDSCLD